MHNNILYFEEEEEEEKSVLKRKEWKRRLKLIVHFIDRRHLVSSLVSWRF